MIFKEIKPGFQLYILYKDNSKLSTTTARVKDVKGPRFPQLDLSNPMQANAMVMDITVDEDGAVKTYTMPEASSVVSAGTTIISTDKEGILREVDAIRATHEDIVASAPKSEEMIRQCDEIRASWSPDFAEKKQHDERISSLETEVKNLGVMMKNFIDKMNGGM